MEIRFRKPMWSANLPEAKYEYVEEPMEYCVPSELCVEPVKTAKEWLEGWRRHASEQHKIMERENGVTGEFLRAREYYLRSVYRIKVLERWLEDHA